MMGKAIFRCNIHDFETEYIDRVTKEVFSITRYIHRVENMDITVI